MFISYYHYIRLAKVSLLLTLACCLTGCLHRKAFEHGQILEYMKPASILASQDGVVAIKVTSTYYNLSDDDDANKKVFLKKIPARERIIILKPTSIESSVKTTTPTVEGSYIITRIVVPSDVTIVPNDFWAPWDNHEPLPPSLSSSTARYYAMNESIPYQIGSRRVFLRFDHVNIDSDRRYLQWWTYPAFFSALIVELPIACAVSVVAFPLELLSLPEIIVSR
jgi:hypothetical protein